MTGDVPGTLPALVDDGRGGRWLVTTAHSDRMFDLDWREVTRWARPVVPKLRSESLDDSWNGIARPLVHVEQCVLGAPMVLHVRNRDGSRREHTSPVQRIERLAGPTRPPGAYVNGDGEGPVPRARWDEYLRTARENERPVPVVVSVSHLGFDLAERAKATLWTLGHHDPEALPRDHPDLVEVVLRLGAEAGGVCRWTGDRSGLAVVMVPGNVDWTVEEYDGIEWVAETHRRWNPMGPVEEGVAPWKPDQRANWARAIAQSEEMGWRCHNIFNLNPQAVAADVKKWREQQGLTTARLAADAGVPIEVVERLEEGGEIVDRLPRLGILQVLSALEVGVVAIPPYTSETIVGGDK